MDYGYYSEIKKLTFYVLGSEEHLLDSAVFVQNKELFKNDLPVDGGCYDAKMGTTEHGWNCKTCSLSKSKCAQHPGSYDLHYPVKSPMFEDYIIKWLKIVCFRCGRLLVTKAIKSLPDLMLRDVGVAAKDIDRCPYADCGEPHPKVVRGEYERSVFYAEYKTQAGVERHELYNHIIRDILGRIPDSVVHKMHIPLICHPKKFILDTIRVPPNGIRPDIRRFGGSRSNNSDITALMKSIVQFNSGLPQEIPSIDVINSKYRSEYFNLELNVHEMVRGTPTGNVTKLAIGMNKLPSSLTSRIPKKKGRVRNNLMGKRTFIMYRNVITGDNTLPLDRIGIPLSIAKTQSIPEVVRPYNRDRLNIFFTNKKKVYPGCSGIIMKSTGHFHNIEYLDANYVLQDGDIIMRDLINGDPGCFNRQPSLLFGQIGCHGMEIMDKGSTTRINVSACAPYGADFDGDTANVIITQNIQARAEAAMLSWIGNWMVSFQNHAPYFGALQDSLIGASELTRSAVQMSKWNAMQLFSNIKAQDLNFDAAQYTGRSIIGKFLPKINCPRKEASYYMEQFAEYILYDPMETHVEIRRGELISGSLDKSTVGEGVTGSIFHIINNEHGARAAVDAIYNFHQITSRFFLWRGMTVGIKDLMIEQSTRDHIKRATATLLANAQRITDRLNAGELIAPIGMSLEEFYEREQMSALNPGDDFIIPLLADAGFGHNRLARMIFTGSKGSKSNLSNINSALGQLPFDGSRAPMNFSHGRTSPYFLCHDTSPESRGFISTSYLEGIESLVYAFAAAEARIAAIGNSLGTSVTGAMNRDNGKNLESICVNNMRQSAKENAIVQLIYGESGIDPRKTEPVKFITAMISDSEMERTFRAKPSDFGKKYDNANVVAALDAEYKQLLEDRQFYRDVYMTVESDTYGQFIFGDVQQMPINPFRILDNVIHNNKDIVAELPKDMAALDPLEAIEKTRELCATLPYAFYNAEYYARQGRIPPHIRAATDMATVLIRMYLCTANLMRKGITRYHLEIVVVKLFNTFKNALISPGFNAGIMAAQCISEPQTQYMLDSRHRGGGGGGTAINAIDRIKEILGAKVRKGKYKPSMMILVMPEYEKSKAHVQEIANHIEMMNFERFYTAKQIFFEAYGKPEHPAYAHEAALIAKFEEQNVGLNVPSHLVRWCIRFELSKEALLTNNMKLETIVTKLRIQFPEMFLVYTRESAPVLVLRCYMTPALFKSKTANISEQMVHDLLAKIESTVIRGVSGIIHTSITDMAKSEVLPDGSVGSGKVFAIMTVGSNLEDVLANRRVDKRRTQTSDINEFYNLYGIDATREKIIMEIRRTISSNKIIREHTSMFADEMCQLGFISSIQRTGLKTRDRENVLLRMSFQSPIQVLEHAAVNGIVDRVGGPSACLAVGQAPNVGTTYNNVCLDEEFVREYARTLGQRIDDSL